jgi:hypothetical protein
VAEESRYDKLPTFAELEGFNELGLKLKYDEAALLPNAAYASFYLEELHRRESEQREVRSEQREKRIVKLTKAIAALTVVIALLTVVNIVYVARQSDGRPSDHHDWPRHGRAPDENR